MRILTNEEIERLVTMPELVAALEEAFLDLESGEAVERPRSHTYTPLADRRYYLFKSMDGGLRRHRVHAIRITSDLVAEVEREGSLRREKVPAAPGGTWVGMILLFSMERLEPLALLQDGWLQRMRVGATSALAARQLVPEEVTEAGLIGTGWQAGAQLLGLAVTRPGLRRIFVFSRNRERREAFCRAMAPWVPFELIPVASAEAAVASRRFWILATNALEPVVDGRWLQPGTHVNSIQGREVDAATVERADLVVVRSRLRPSHLGPKGFVPLEAERGIEQRVDASAKMVSLGAVLSGAVRRRPEWVTLFGGGGTGGSGGLGIQFAAVARVAYEKAVAHGVGTEVPGEYFRERYTP